MNTITDLGEDQWKWLNKFKRIDLNDWRLFFYDGCNKQKPPQWMYIGNWKIEDGYPQRKRI